MSKVLLYTDNHWSQYSSIIRRRGEFFSERLENQILSINWAEELALNTGCTKVICLGDFFDKENLNSEELSALNEVKWSQNLEHYFLVGNHEMGLNNLTYNSAKVFNMITHCQTISKPEFLPFSNILFIPYDLKASDRSIKDYFKDGNIPDRLVVLSHNDIKGIQYGKYTSQQGFDLKDIEDNCALFINGHLHNGTYLNERKTILNLGNLTGQNFSENAYQYGHYACVLDLDTLELEFYENPYAFNFYKIDFTNNCTQNQIEDELRKLKNNSVVTVKINEIDTDFVRNCITKCSNIRDNRVIIQPTITERNALKTEDLVKLDHMKQFYDYILNDLGNNQLVIEELEAINVN